MKRVAPVFLAFCLALAIARVVDTSPDEPAPIARTAAAAPTTTTTVAASSCEVVREALLTGTPAEITAAMSQLKGDRTANITAREGAARYLTDTDLRESLARLIQTYCDL